MKKTLFALVLFFCISISVYADEPNVNAPAAILIEPSTGTVLFEKNADERRPMASVTKTMTLLIAAEMIDNGTINLDDIVSVSENASSMTGSRVYLSTNEKISVSDLLKSIAVSSGNDAAVAMAEHISGSEDNFVKLMNDRALELKLKNTHFINCYGLDADEHYSSARDLAVVSAHLLKHEIIRPYLTIWMDSIREGTFTLSNTNKLVRFYEGCTGVKTGFTSKAMYCLSASALRENMELIAVVLGAHNSKARFADASGLLNYGFDNYSLIDLSAEAFDYGTTGVFKGKKASAKLCVKGNVNIIVNKSNKNEISFECDIKDKIKAPVNKGDVLGKVTYYVDGDASVETELISDSYVDSMGILDYFNKLLLYWLNI